MNYLSLLLAASFFVTPQLGYSIFASPFAALDARPASVLPSADDVIAQAKTRAAAERKNILLVFSASWCGPCRQFEALLDDPKTGPIMSQYFVVARLDVGERPADKRHSDSPGGEAFRASLDGASAGYPFIVLLDPAAKVIVNSYRPIKGHATGENIGYPAVPEEIDWFMKMLQQGAPAMSPKEASTIQMWLQQRGRK